MAFRSISELLYETLVSRIETFSFMIFSKKQSFGIQKACHIPHITALLQEKEVNTYLSTKYSILMLSSERERVLFNFIMCNITYGFQNM